jgi:hypothetical protein
VWIATLGLIFFTPLVLHPGQVLYSDHSDFLAVHLPATCFQVSSLRQNGELPLWLPYCFAGRPFAHDLYPLHLPLLLLSDPERPWSTAGIGAYMSWLLVAHVILAGWGMYAYGLSQGLKKTGAFAAALVFMFGGAWLLHLLGGGHYLPGLAWLPWVLLCLDRAIREGKFVWATLAGVLFGLMLFGLHPQWTFYAGILIALWTLGTALETERRRDGETETERQRDGETERQRDTETSESPANALSPPLSVSPSLRLSVSRLGRWLLFGAWTATLGVGLAALTVLPTLDFARESSRVGGVSGGGDWLILGRQTLHNLVGPSIQLVPEQGSAWEERGGLGLIVLALAVMAPLLVQSPRVWFQAGVCLFLFLFALGGAALFQSVPGFNAFREPARMFLIAAFPVAQLVGVSINALLSERGPDAERRQLGRFVLIALTLIIALLVGVWAWQLSRMPTGHELTVRVYWFSLLITLPAALWLLGQDLSLRPHPGQTTILAIAWIAILLIDLWSLVLPFVDTRPMAEIFPMSESVRVLAGRGDEHGRVLDVDVVEKDGLGLCSPLGRGEPLALLHRVEPLRGYSPVDLVRYKEFLNFMADRDAPLVPLRDDLTFPVIGNLTVTNRSLLDLLGARFILQPAADPPPAGCTKVLEDGEPRAFDLAAGGVRPLGANTLYENTQALLRAFVVSNAEPIPARSDVLAKLKATDFRRTVLIDGLAEPEHHEGTPRAARITGYQPNRVIIDVDPGEAGYLVLTDPWFHGWTCTVDDQPVEVLCGDYAFRAIALPADARRVVFLFQPASFTWGLRISVFSVLVVALMLAISLAVGRRQPKPQTEKETG